METRLTAAEMHTCRLLASQRASKRNSKKNTGRYSEDFTHLIGLYGEKAFSKVVGVALETRTLFGGDGGVDFHIAGETYQIKTRNTSTYSEPDLLVSVGERECDWYVLCWWSDDAPAIVDIVGYCDWDRLRQEKRDFGYGDSYIVPHGELEDIHDLIQRTRRRT